MQTENFLSGWVGEAAATATATVDVGNIYNNPESSRMGNINFW